MARSTSRKSSGTSPSAKQQAAPKSAARPPAKPRSPAAGKAGAAPKAAAPAKAEAKAKAPPHPAAAALPQAPAQGSGKIIALTLSAIGVVFGDIGTSPLYALRQCFDATHGIAPLRENVLGIVSLLLWSLTLIVCVKYLLVVLRADNRGEGGILALTSLVGKSMGKKGAKAAGLFTLLGIIGASLLYSDGMLTPAVSVLSAIEGLEVITPSFKPLIVPLAILVLVLLFTFQYKGTAKVSKVFAPVLCLWFVAIAVLGLLSIAKGPAILAAANPAYALSFLAREGRLSLGVLGAVFLSLTGAEVLYADMGHFGRSPIRRAWFALVYPALLLNYLGQGAFLLARSDATANLFFQLAPAWALYPLVILATMATIIASQAVISGSFSLTRQSVQLGYWPRVQIRHTSSETIGQVYVPLVNWALMAGTVALVLGFRESAKLADAYGIAVSATMLITTCLTIIVARRLWKVPLWILVPGAAVFLVIDISYFAANSIKILSGGWIVVSVALVMYLLMRTWLDGRGLFARRIMAARLDPDIFAESISLNPPHRVKGSAVFLSGDPAGVPRPLLHNLKNNRVMHERTLMLSVITEEVPTVEPGERLETRDLGQGIWHVILRYGFSETPDVPAALKDVGIPGFSPDAMDTSYFVGQEALVVGRGKGMSPWRKRLFSFMFSNASAPTDFFRLPPNRVVVLGAQNEI